MKKENKLSITIDNRKVQVKTGLTILQAAREHDIYIPSLCTLEPLPSYGACRLCIVEVDGLRFPSGRALRQSTGVLPVSRMRRQAVSS